MTHRTVTSSSLDDTRALGKKLGALLRDGDFIGLVGNLGAGKTQLARGIAEGAGVAAQDVTSPTYSIIQTYSGRLTLHHADLYRLQSVDDLVSTGFLDVLEAGGAAVVEWVDQVPGALPADALNLELKLIDERTREITAVATGARAQSLLEAWLA